MNLVTHHWRPLHYLAATVTLLTISACERSPEVHPAKNSQGGPQHLVLSQVREIAPGTIWDRELNALRPGTLKLSVSGAAPFTVTLVSHSVYQQLVTGGRSLTDFQSGIFVNSRSDAESFETTCRLEPGRYWISITNKSSGTAPYDLKCHSW
jgi:hypothetical protein